jgi:hypothetical protein
MNEFIQIGNLAINVHFISCVRLSVKIKNPDGTERIVTQVWEHGVTEGPWTFEGEERKQFLYWWMNKADVYRA